MKLPRDASGAELVKALEKLGYTATRQRGSHTRITTNVGGEHHEVVPMHSPVKIGTLRGNLRSVAAHHQLSVEELLKQLDL